MKTKKDTTGFVETMFSHLPGMMLKLMSYYLGFKTAAKRGAEVFLEELVAQGVDKNTAEKLTNIYLDNARLLKHFK